MWGQGRWQLKLPGRALVGVLDMLKASDCHRERTITMYPLLLTNMHTVRCVVIGGGGVAERKVRALLVGGARPLVVSPTLTAGLHELRNSEQIGYREGHYCVDDLRGATLAFAATNDSALNAAIASDAQQLGVLVNIVDAPEAGNLHTMATLRRGDLLVAVATGGHNPALAAYLRDQFAASYGEEFAQVVQLAGQLRKHMQEMPNKSERRAILDWLCSNEALHWLREGKTEQVLEQAKALNGD
jgi:precorrin-2 dehydrogenase / sirohydrochlorin ferrochelatase